MRFLEPDVEKKGLVGLADFLQPVDSFIGNDLAGVAFYFTYFLSIAEKVCRVPVTRGGVVVGGEPVVESVVGQGRLVSSPERRAEVPLAEVHRLVTVAF